MGEISNLISMSVVDKNSWKEWLEADKKKRMHKFSPAKIRKILEKHGSEYMYADKNWYSKFCEDYTHVHPKTKPNAHNTPHIGGAVKSEGLSLSINELTNVIFYISIIVSKYAGLDDLFDDLANLVKK